MSQNTNIAWATDVWNPVTGCDRVSEGCGVGVPGDCYALTLAKRLKAMGNPRYQRDGDPRTSGSGFGLTLHWDKLEEPRHWRKSRRVFVNSMSDLGHEAIPFEFFGVMFEEMANAPQHQFLILTKRPGSLRSRVRRWYRERLHDAGPLPNVWLGVSAENQHWANVRIPALVDMPAAVRFVSAEPLLAPLDLSPWLASIHWLIVGGQSGSGWRPMDLEWARRLRDQSLRAGIAFFYKQGAGPRPEMDRELDGETWEQFPATTSPR